jgi:NTP pyrophosphatase (non-canonical NTP hydrolase)
MDEFTNEDIKKRRSDRQLEKRTAENEAAIKRLEREIEDERVLREELSQMEADQVEPLITFEEYQFGAKKTAIYNQDARVLYPALGLAGEVGEVAEKVLAMAAHAGKCANQVKKIIRDDDCECDTDRKHEIGKEIGGVLWYCAAVATDLGLDLGAIAKENLGVLADRQKRGVIQGSGDNR